MAQLIAPVSASTENQRNRQSEETEEELLLYHQRTRLVGSEVSDKVVRIQDDEDTNDGNLKSQTDHGEIDAHLADTFADCREGTAGRLENETDHVRRNEEPVEKLGFNSRDFGREMFDTVFV